MNNPIHSVDIPVINIEQAIRTFLETDQSWNFFLNNGAMETIIAGSHQGRYLLELIQNARDAASKDESGNQVTSGKTLVLVNENGILVFNTGQPFHLDQQKVLNAVCNIDQSTKDSKDFIGHKGIGMKSIRLQAGAFSIITCLNGYGVRVNFSRADTARFCLKAAAERDEHCKERVYATLPRLPLFSMPFIGRKQALDTKLPMQTLLELADLSPREIDLLPKEVLQSNFVTIVALWFEDDGWNDLLDEAENQPLPGDLLADFRRKRVEQKRDTIGQADSVWEEVNDIGPESIILMDVLDRVDFIRMQEGVLLDQRQITIQREPVVIGTKRDLTIEIVHIFENQNPETRFLLVGQANEQDQDAYQPRLLFPLPTDGRLQRMESKPLYMFYPIRHQFSGLPFIIHGQFNVSPERTQLYFKDRSDTHNQDVIQSALHLFETCLPVLSELNDLKDWLPWLLLPGKPTAQPGSNEQQIETKLRDGIVAIMKQQVWIPTTLGPRRPAEVLYMQTFPKGYNFIHSIPEARKEKWGFALLNPTNLEYRSHLISENVRDNWEFDETLIGFGVIANAELIDKLIRFWQECGLEDDDFPDTASAGIEFFKIVCTLLKNLHDPAKIKEKAQAMGRVKAAMLPVQQDRGQPIILRAVSKSAQGEEALRVLFCPPYSEEGEIPVLPSSAIKVYFMPQELTEFLEGKDFKQLFIDLRVSWGISRYNSRADLFRRVSEWMDELSKSESSDWTDTVKVVGYLAGLLDNIQMDRDSDLNPVPYTHIDSALLHEIFGGDNDKAKDSREKLLRKQGWLRIYLPADEQAEKQMAGDLIFGPEWADLLRKEGCEESAYVELIDLLPVVCPGNPRILPPDHPGWQPAFEILRKFRSDAIKNLHSEKIALFRLLLLIGVRVGPGIEWRWLDKTNLPTSDERVDHAIYNPDYQNGLPRISAFPGDQAPDQQLYAQYHQWILAAPYHQTFYKPRVNYYPGFTSGDAKREILISTVWFTGLIYERFSKDRNPSPFSTWFEMFVRLPKKTSQPVLNAICQTTWYSNDSPGCLGVPVPTLAAYQLTHLPLWIASGAEHPDLLPAYSFIADKPAEEDKKGKPLPFPRIQSYLHGEEGEDDQAITTLETILGICSIGQMNLIQLVEHLRWLLRNPNMGGSASQDIWEIQFDQDEIAVLRTLLLRIAELDDKSGNGEYVYKTLDLTVPAVQASTGQFFAVRGDFIRKLKYFDRSPTEWQLQQLREDQSFVFWSSRQALPEGDGRLTTWAKARGIEPVSNQRKANDQAYLTNPEAEQLRAQAEAQVMESIDLLMGFIKANGAQENTLREYEKRIPNALQGMKVVQNTLGLYPLGTGNTLLLSIEDYGDQQNAVCLAFGLVLILKTESLLESFSLALSADRATVERILRQKDIDLDTLRKELPDLFEWSLLNRANQLMRAMEMESLQATGKEQVLLQVSERLGLPNRVVAQALTGARNLQTAQRISAEIRRFGWEIDKHEKFLLGLFSNITELVRQQDTLLKFFSRLAIAQAILDNPVEQSWQEVARGNWVKLMRNLPMRLSGLHDFQRVDQLGLGDLIEAWPDCSLLLDLKDEMWQELSTALCRAIQKELEDQGENVDVFHALEEGQLPSVPEEGSKAESSPRSHIRKAMLQKYLEGNLFCGTWPASNQIASASTQVVVNPGNYGTYTNLGFSGGRRDSVTPGMEQNGEVAEFFVIHLLWNLFLAASGNDRMKMIKNMIQFRDGHPYWGTKARWSADRLELQTVLEHLKDSKPFDEQKLQDLFQRAVDLSDIGLAGFDVLDPTGEQVNQIEIKSTDLTRPSVWMTTHEFHTAKEYGDTYVLRLVSIPGNISDLSGYCYMDIINPFKNLNLKDSLFSSVSGGKFHFSLTLRP